ncbi:MAG: hypothetical protein AAFV77_08695 [Planctomycetota bacterium]
MPRPVRRCQLATILMLTALLCAAACLPGCGGRAVTTQDETPSAPASAVAPAGLSVRAEVHVRDTIAARRYASGVYLLEPDGTLRAGGPQPRSADDPMPALPQYPPILRRLDPSDVNRVWRLIGGTTLADPDSPERIPPIQDWAPLPNRSIALVQIRDHNGTRRFAVSLTGATPAAIEAQALVERLQALAWNTPQPLTPTSTTGQ